MPAHEQSPGYRQLYESGELETRAGRAESILKDCNLCPHNCKIHRAKALGFCRAGHQVLLSSYGPHFGEEAPLVGQRGSGTIFFGYCNMRCVFCQNSQLSFKGEGRIISDKTLARAMLELQDRYSCHNINLVSPTHFVPNILQALVEAARAGLSLPLVYNCGGYENISTLKLLDGLVDIYMPDFKYDLAEKSLKYSGAGDYPVRVKAALKEMDRQVGGIQLDSRGIARRGLLIRHLILPGELDATKRILTFIRESLLPDCMVNLMDQYYPAHQAYKYRELNRRLSPSEFREAQEFALELGLRLV